MVGVSVLEVIVAAGLVAVPVIEEESGGGISNCSDTQLTLTTRTS